MRVVVAFVTIMALMAVALMPVDMAVGQEVNPDRVLPHTVERGQTFNVTVTFTAPADEFNSIGLIDFCPDGWKVTVDTAWCTPNADTFTATGNKAEIGWFGEPYVGFDNGTSFTALYKVTVPYDASAGIYTFDGFLEYWVGPGGPGESHLENITGDSEVEVVAGKEANPSRILPETVERGQTFDVTVTFIAPVDKFNAIGLTDFCPDDWDVTVNVTWCTPMATLVKGTGNKAEIGWSGEPDVGFDNGTLFTAVYKVTVPGDAPAGIYTFGGSVEYQVGPKGPYLENITGDSEVKVSVSREEANPSRILPDTVERGQTFNVTVTFTATADNFTAISLIDLAPDDWDVTVDKTWCQPQGSWIKATGNMAELAWQGPYDGGVDFTALYKVTVPCGASVGNYIFSGYEGLGYFVGPSGHIFENITGDSEVEVVPPAICSNQSISLYAAVGQNPEDETLELWSSTSCMLNWSLTDDAAWLSESAASGSSTSADDKTVVTVSVNTADMSAGDYSANITITAPGASNTPRIVPVSLHIGEVAPPPQPWLNRYWWTILAGIVVVLLVYFLRRRGSA